MSEVVIIADDLTGANATSILLTKLGYKAATFLNLEEYNNSTNKDFPVISINTDSRGKDIGTAYERVTNVANSIKKLKPALISKRIDSTLRGNVGVEIDAVLDQLNPEYVAIVVAAFPSSGRISIGGYLMVNLKPVEKTDVSKDPKTPVNESYIPALIAVQSQHEVGYISLNNVLSGIENLSEKIVEQKRDKKRIIVIDATSDDDIETIAKAVINTDINLIAVDPGPFTFSLMKEYSQRKKGLTEKKVMLSVGSVSNLTRRQLEMLIAEHNCLIESVDASALVFNDRREIEIKTVVDKLISRMASYRIVGIITSSDEGSVLDLTGTAKVLNITEEEVSKKIATGIAEITERLIMQTKDVIGGLYTSGGDVTVAVCKQLKASGIEVKSEVLPLAVYGTLIDGPYKGLGIVTKGGLVGSDYAMSKCVEHLLMKN
jgi:uncharacterized protein YgbK (DUF1537 family)